MHLDRLTLKNFKGIRDLTVDFKGPVTSIYATNAVGKTTLADAFNWLLFGKDSLNQANFEIKPNGEHFLNHEVLANIDGLSLMKRMSEKWVKKRGSAEKEFTGHTIDYFIDEVPVAKKEYDARVSEMAPEDLFKLLTNPRYFSDHMHWQKRRETLIGICGDVSDADVMASSSELFGISEWLKGRTIDQFRKIITAKRKKINDELSEIPARISELDRVIVRDMVGFTGDKLVSANKDLHDQLQAKERERIMLLSGSVSELESKLLDVQNRERTFIDEATSEHKKQLRTLQDAQLNVQSLIIGSNQELDKLKWDHQKQKSLIDEYRKEWIATNGMQYQGYGLCPTCHQSVPESMMQEAIEAFNLSKSKELERITDNANYCKNALSLAEKRMSEIEASLATYKMDLDVLTDKIASAQAATDSVTVPADLIQERDRLRAEIVNRKSSAPDTAPLDAEIQSINETIAKNNETLAAIRANKTAIDRIDELKKQERKLSEELVAIDGELYLLDRFTVAKVAMLEDRINSRFKITTFKLFDTQINGGLSECCEIMHNGVPYNSMNNAARINCGLDVIDVLSKHYGFNAPIWIDNAESVVDLLPTQSQQIRLVVSPQDQTFRIEHQEA